MKKAKLYFKKADGTWQEVTGATVNGGLDPAPEASESPEPFTSHIPGLADFEVTITKWTQTLDGYVLLGPQGQRWYQN